MSISIHTIVCNEEKYIWYSIMSVATHVDKIFVWDTGSNDSTVKIIKEIKKILGQKLDFQEVGRVNSAKFTEIRGKMLEKTNTDWFLVLDGDEVWWEQSIRKLLRVIKKEGDKLDSIVVPYYNLVGDIYHYQDEAFGKYRIDGRQGFLTIRAINRKIPGLAVVNKYPLETYIDSDGVAIQGRVKKQRRFVDVKYMHFTHLLRSSTLSKNKEVTSREKKFKYEIGKSFPLDFYYPEVFFRPRPSIVDSAWRSIDTTYLLKAHSYYFPRQIKRSLRKVFNG